MVSPAANGVPAEGSVNSLSLIDRTAERNHNLIAALIIPMQNERCPFYRLYVKTIYQIVFTTDTKRHFFLEKKQNLMKGKTTMAIYHLEAKVISRGVGRSAVAASAYMSCSRIYNEYDGILHDYTRKQGLVYEQIFLPPQAPTEWKDRCVLWNAVEETEKTKDSRLAREFVVSLPVELDREQNIALISEYVQENFVADGMCADVCIHDTDGHNPHAHIMLTVRPLDENGKWQAKTQKEYLCKRGNEERGFTADEFKTAQADGWEKQYQYFAGKKKVYLPPSQAEAQGLERASKYPKSTRYGRQNLISERWNSEEQLQLWRKNWADIANRFLEQVQSESRIDHRSHKTRGIDEQPTIYEGISARILEKKGGVSERCELNRDIKADNKLLREIKANIKRLLETASHTISSIANALEKLRGTMIHCRYVINFTDKWKTAKATEAARLKIHCNDYAAVTAELKSKTSERRQKQAEKAHTPPVKIFRRRELTQSIHELSEQIEELRTEKNAILANLNTNDIRTVKTKISEIQKAVPVMDRHANESKVKLDNAQKEYAELTEQAQGFDTEELQNLRYDIRPQIETEIISELRKIYNGSFIQNIYDTAKSETDQSIGETGKRSIREHLRTKKEQQKPNAKNKSKHHEQER